MPDKPSVAEYNRLVGVARMRAQRHEPAIRTAVYQVLEGAVNRAVAAFRDRVVSLTASAQWAKVNPNEVYDAVRVEAELHRALGGVYVEVTRDVMEGIMRRYGLSFDLRNPLAVGVLDQFGRRITNISDTERKRLMTVLDEQWTQGAGVREAAAALQQEGAVNASRAAMIARTEIIGLTNGSSWALTRLTGAARFKVWMVAYGAKHPRHELLTSLQDQVRPLVQAFTVDGHPAQYPGDPSLPPEHAIQCRCTLRYSDDPGGALG